MKNEILVKHFQTFGQVVAIHRYEKETQGLLQFRNRFYIYFQSFKNCTFLNLCVFTLYRKQAQSALGHVCHQVEGISLTIQPRSKTTSRHYTNSGSFHFFCC